MEEKVKEKIIEDIKKLYEESSSKEEFEMKLEKYLEGLEAMGILDLIEKNKLKKLRTQINVQ